MEERVIADGSGAWIEEVEWPRIPDRTLALTEFGSPGLGDNGRAFSQALEQLSAAGGGRLVVGAGLWCTGPIRLKSRIELHLEAGAVGRFSRNPEDYELILTQFEGLPSLRCRSPLDGEGLEDVAITGEGVFDGGGEVWRPVKKAKTTARQWRDLIAEGGVLSRDESMWWPSALAREGAEVVPQLIAKGIVDRSAWAPYREYLRPQLLSARRCRRVWLQGVTFQNSAAWCLHLWASTHIRVQGITVRNPWYAQNGDGIDIDSCQWVGIEQSLFDVGDDAICLKSGKDRAGRELNIPTRYVSIRNCTVLHGHGGVTIGSEMSGGVDRVRVSDLTLIGTDIGLRFKSTRGRGGVVEDVVMDRVRMLDIAGEAISFDMFYESSVQDPASAPLAVTEETPTFRNIAMRHLTIDGANRVLKIRGLPERAVAEIEIAHLQARASTGILAEHVANLRLADLQVNIERGPLVDLNHVQGAQMTVAPEKMPPQAPHLQVSGATSRDIQYRFGTEASVRVVVDDSVPWPPVELAIGSDGGAG